MAWDSPRLKSRAAAAAVLGALLVLVLGALAFFLAFRPCRLRFAPGQLVTYRLHTEIAEVGADGRCRTPLVQDQDLNLICVNEDNDVVLLSPEGGRDVVTLMNFTSNGAARCLDGASRPGEAGKALGFFDFNLLPLPPGSEQAWNVDLTYATLPPSKRSLQGRVRRTRSGANPEFQLKLPPSVEWVNEQNRYQQVRDLVCTYRFHTGKGLVDRASVRCQAGVEREDGLRHYQVRADLDLLGIGHTGDDPRQVRDLALASTEAQDALADGRHERLAPVLVRILAADVQDPRLRELARRMALEVRNPPPAPPITPRPLWAVQLATMPEEHRDEAERFARTVSAGGFHAYLATAQTDVLVLVGPYVDRDPAVIATLAQRYPEQRTVWVKAEP